MPVQVVNDVFLVNNFKLLHLFPPNHFSKSRKCIYGNLSVMISGELLDLRNKC